MASRMIKAHLWAAMHMSLARILYMASLKAWLPNCSCLCCLLKMSSKDQNSKRNRWTLCDLLFSNLPFNVKSILLLCLIDY